MVKQRGKHGLETRATKYAWLGGEMIFEEGTRKDYREMERFHYVPGAPATVARVLCARFCDRVVGVAVLSYPTPACKAREEALKLSGERYGPKLRWINQNLRTIARVIVHPQFRGVGLASDLVRFACARSSTQFVEAIARMGRIHPFFAKGGMRQMGTLASGAVYYLFDSGGVDGGAIRSSVRERTAALEVGERVL